MKRRPVPSPGESAGCVKVVRDIASCVAGLLLIAAFLVALGYAGVLEGLWRAGYGGP